MTENILITGGAGFIGSHLAEKLVKEGHKVKVIDDFSNSTVNNIRGLLNYPNFKLIKGDIRDYSLIKEISNNIDTIYHLAAQIHVDKSITESRSTQEINYFGTLNMLEAMREHDIEKFIFASSSEVYGSAQYSPMDEKHPLDAQSPYAASKAGADRLCYSYFKTYGMDITVVRNFNTYGPKQKDGGYGSAISIFIRRVLNNQPPIIYGDGTQSRDYMYIKDAITAYTLVKENKKKLAGEVINFGTGKDHTILDISNRIIKLCGKDNLKPVHIEQRPGEVQKLCADTKKVRSLLGFKPEYDLEKGLKEYINWFKTYKDIGWN